MGGLVKRTPVAEHRHEDEHANQWHSREPRHLRSAKGAVRGNKLFVPVATIPTLPADFDIGMRKGQKRRDIDASRPLREIVTHPFGKRCRLTLYAGAFRDINQRVSCLLGYRLAARAIRAFKLQQ